MTKDNKKKGAWEPIERGEYGFSSDRKWRCIRCKQQSVEPELICPKCGSEMKIHFLCDPDRNTECTKSFCFINGGLCRHTTNFDAARNPNDVGLDKWKEYDAKAKGWKR